MLSLVRSVDHRCEPLKRLAETYLLPVVLLLMRLYVACPFFKSGRLKLGYILHGQTGTLYYVFEDYKVPYLPVKLAAWLGTCGELGLSTLLALGLYARFGACGLIVMSAVIYHTDGNKFAAAWALICALIACYGPGPLALDAISWRKK